MMMLRSVNGGPAPQQASCTLCHSTSNPSTSFSNMQYGSYCAGTSVGKAAVQALKCKGMMNPMALMHISHGHFLTARHLRFSPLSSAVSAKASVRYKLKVNAVDAGQSGGDEYPQEISSSDEEITPEKAADKNKDSRLDFDFSSAQAASEEAARKALVILQETTSQLREQAEKASSVLAASAQELPARGSTVSIRFGVLLGGVILALSVTSLSAWKQGESTLRYIQGQIIITGAIFFRFIRRYGETKSVFPTGVIAVTSAAMLAFYAYVYLSDINPPKEIESGGSY
ncbi:unnamed protein product [Sphagnum troendelagicum]|uniref:Uncharacterized protein n=1 Tax=Sphagnum troendelagicum TaxID=128251 RepID=A0ABP0UIR4_9BRYO